MPEQLKELFNRDFVSSLADKVRALYPSFRKDEFYQAVFNPTWKNLELKQRMRHISITLRAYLPFSYARQIALLTEIASSFEGLPAMVFPDFVEAFGLEHPDISIPALEYFTRFSSSEFAVRPFLENHFDRMLRHHSHWARHDNPHVRRLASEGCRPRLPWAASVKRLKEEPYRIIPILETLKEDESEYVRRSVANNLNDISKDHPELVLELARNWQGKSAQTDKLIRHGLRTLLKKGNKEALKISGIDQGSAVEVSNFRISDQSLKIGDSLGFSFEVRNPSTDSQDYRLEYAVYYLKSNGSHSKKVFHISRTEILAKQGKQIIRRQSLKDFTTRKHYPGEHYISLIVNGQELEKLSFRLRP